MAAERALVVDLRTARRAFLHHHDLLDRRAVEREELLHAHAVAVAGDREVSGGIAAAVTFGWVASLVSKPHIK